MQTNGFIRVALALNSKHRLTIVNHFMEGNDFIGYREVIRLLGTSPSTVSHHLNLMVRAGVLEVSKKDRLLQYKLNRQIVTDYFAFITSFNKDSSTC
jgi:DNA-binding IclR family transcriptional regulator